MTQSALIQVGGHSMQTNEYVGTGEGLEIPSQERTARAFEQILSSTIPSFYKRAYRLLGNGADAEDAVQDALLAAFTHLNQFKGQAHMSSWLTSIVLNCARMQLRTRRGRVHVPLDEPSGSEKPSVSARLADHRPSPEDECRDSELNERLTHFQTQLSPTLRRTFHLRDIDGLSIQETAQTLGVPIGTVKARSARARKKITDLMRRATSPRSVVRVIKRSDPEVCPLRAVGV